MKVLFIISTLRAGGAERVASLLASEFAIGNDVSLARFDNEKPFYEMHDKVKLLSLDLGTGDCGFFGNFKKRFSKIFTIRKLIKNGEFDCVISFMDSTNLLVLLGSIFLKTKIIISEHSYHKFLSFKWRVLKRFIYPFADGLSVLTKEDFEYYKFVKNRAVIYNPMFFNVDIDTNELEKENIMIFVGRLIKAKGCDVFLEALSLIKDELKDWKILVLGDGDEISNLKNLAKNINLNIEFCGMVNNISNYYKKAKILVLSSRSEGLGNAFIEAIFYNILRVSTPTSGAKELIKDGFDGLISEDFSAKSLSKKIKMSLSGCDSLVENAKLRQSEFEIKNIYNRWLNLIKEAAN
ncbi:glycosyltransferase [Campylobacter fetus]|uniref:glycosyltransferase n=1 Tax=Campylobacter fetus TaxID=196 RepID=UPI000FCB258D|nr:glycosyltransferase [Campylobacter fetus]RUT50556.1 general glycosylation pathway protein [Campylobacter fetus]RUT50873.1 general glycosylation pathway protein [Campylobacter fetus]